MERNTLDAVGRFAAWVVLVGIAGAAALGLLAFRNRWLLVLRATVAGLAAVLLSVGFTALSFDAAAFQAPSYTGSLRLVPQLFGPVEGAIERVGYFREELRRVVAGAARAYAAIESNPLGRGDEIRVLHISDIHLSTLGYDFAQELARSFDVDLVMDTGDTTSFGAPDEEFILSEIPAFGHPYVWVRGNHDSAAFQEALDRVEGTVVLDGETEEVGGFTVYGLGHPYFNEERGTPVGDEDVVELVAGAADQVLADVSALPEPPDIVLVHDDRMAAEIAGLVPLVLSGHFHEARDEVRDGTVFLRVGTTGGAGPTGFTAEGDVPFSAEVLYFQPDEEGRMDLVAWDVVTQFPETGSLQIARHLASDVGLSPSPSVAYADLAEPLLSLVTDHVTRSIPIEEPYDLAGTLFPLRRGTGDPTMRIERGVTWRAARTPDGPVTLLLEQMNGAVRATAWGAGASWALDHAPGLIGAEDDVSAFVAHDDVMARMWKEHRSARLTRALDVVRTLIAAILEQKVVGMEARRAWRRMTIALSEPAPGEAGLMLPPDPATVAEVPYYRFHPWGVERRRAEVIRAVCARAASLEALADVPFDDARRRLEAMPGIGPWTTAEVIRLSFGDPDAVSVGDYHLPDIVGWAFAKEQRGTDERMLELLEPYRGQRGRVQVLLERSQITPPAYGPRMEARSIEKL